MTYEDINPHEIDENHPGVDQSPASEEHAQSIPGSAVKELPAYTIDQLPAGLRDGFDRLGWTDLMPVQARAIPYILASRDLMMQSRTGSGKTGAYLVPIMERINPELNATQALVLTPTRELAVQVTREAEALGQAMNVRAVPVYGGVGYGAQLDAFRQGAHLVVGTPGRILDHLLRRSLTLDKLKILVFDEADRMLSMGFYPDMKRVQRYLPDRPISSYMFSATYPVQVIGLANEFMRNPEFLNLSSDHIHVTETQHVYYSVPAMDKERSLIRVIEVENPASAIVFCNRRERVHFVAVILQRYGYNAAEISSDLSQVAREEVMAQIRAGTLRFLVATDVAARGIDIPELSHVILYEVPEDPESYIHRAGRTGRAGASGVAISLVNALERVELGRISKRFQIELEDRPLPTDEDVQAIIAQRTMAMLEARVRDRDRLQTERMERFYTLLRSLDEDDDALAGIAALLDDFYHDNFHTSQTPQPVGQREPISGHEGGRSVHKQRYERRPGGGERSGSRNTGRSWDRATSGGDNPPKSETASNPTGEGQPGGRSGRPRRRRRGGSSRSGGQPGEQTGGDQNQA